MSSLRQLLLDLPDPPADRSQARAAARSERGSGRGGPAEQRSAADSVGRVLRVLLSGPGLQSGLASRLGGGF